MKKKSKELYMDNMMPIIIFLGRFTSNMGYGISCRNYFRALKESKLPIVGVDVHELNVIGFSQNEFVETLQTKDGIVLHPNNLDRNVVVVSDEIPPVLNRIRVSGRVHLVCLTVFETESLPNDWIRPLLSTDGVWVPSNFNKQTFSASGVPESMINVVPHCIDTKLYSGRQPQISIDKNDFSFLAIISNFNRKDIGMLLRSYYRAFDKNDNVSLIIKFPANVKRSDFEQFIRDSVFPDYDISSPDLPHVLVLSGNLSSERIRGLLAVADVCVSIERGKGWDLPAMESMALGVPVIGIGWSANIDFMTDENSFLIPSAERTVFVDDELVTNRKLYAGNTWSTAYESDIAAAMRLAYENRDLVTEKGALARQDITDNFSYERIAAKISDIIVSKMSSDFRGKDTAKIEIGKKPFK